MYAQQSTSTSSTSQQSSSSQTASARSATQQTSTATDARRGQGNQALLEEAGLQAQGGGEDSSQGDSMLGMVLECLPLDAAVPMAVDHIEDPSVQAWAARQDLLSVARVAARWRPELLDVQWPIGLGLSLHGTLGGALAIGADIASVTQVVRVDRDRYRVTVNSEFGFDPGVDDIGFKALAAGVDPDTATGLALTGGLGVGVDSEGQTELSLPQLLLAGLAASATGGAATLLLMQAGDVLDLADDAGWLNIRDHVDLPDFEFENRAYISAEAQGRAAGNELMAIPGVLGAIQMVLTPFMHNTGVAELMASGRMELITSAGLMALRRQTEVSGLLELSRARLLNGILDADIVNALVEGVGAHARSTLVLPFAPVGDAQSVTVDGSAASLELELGAEQGETAQTDSITIPLLDLPRVITSLVGSGDLTELLGAASLTRRVELPADPSMVGNAVVDLLGDTIDFTGGKYPVGGTEDLRVVGSLTAGNDVLGALADAGVQAPPELNPARAMLDVYDALCSTFADPDAATVADWLSPWADTIVDAARHMVLETPRLQGELLVGAGGSLALSLGEKASGKIRLLAGIVVDQPIEGQSEADIRQALAHGVFSDAPQPEQECVETDVLDEIDGATCEQEATPQREEPGATEATADSAAADSATTASAAADSTAAPVSDAKAATDSGASTPADIHADTGTETVDADAPRHTDKGDDTQSATANGPQASTRPPHVGRPRRRPGIGRPPKRPWLRR